MTTPKMTIQQFYGRFPDDDACLEHIMRVRFGLEHVCRRCGQRRAFARIPARRIYRCRGCGAQISPCAGTIFSYGKASLHDWFYVICVAPDDITVRDLAAHIGVGFNTALRMKQRLREQCADDWAVVLNGGFALST